MQPTEVAAYQSILRSLRYIADTTHPEIAFIVGLLGRHLQSPTPRHFHATKRILRYLKGVRRTGINYRRETTSNMTTQHFMAYADSDWAQCPDTRKSTTGIVFLYAGAPVHWVSRKQGTVSQSSSEAEYVSASHATRDLMWILQLANGWHIELLPSTEQATIRLSTPTLCLDNKGAIDMADGSGPTKRTKHIDVKHHYIQEKVNTRKVRLQQIPTAQQLADTFTKPLKRVLFTNNAKQLNIRAPTIEGGC